MAKRTPKKKADRPQKGDTGPDPAESASPRRKVARKAPTSKKKKPPAAAVPDDPPPPPPPEQATTETERLDAHLAAAAVRKEKAGQRPTPAESAALRRVVARREENQRWAHYRSIPQRHWKQMSGRQTKVLNEQAQRYGIPFGGPEVNLEDVVRALHDFLAENAARLASTEVQAVTAEQQAQLADLKIKRLEAQHRKEIGEFVDRQDIETGLAFFAEAIRSAAKRVEKQFGANAKQILDDALDDAVRGIEEALTSP